VVVVVVELVDRFIDVDELVVLVVIAVEFVVELLVFVVVIEVDEFVVVVRFVVDDVEEVELVVVVVILHGLSDKSSSTFTEWPTLTSFTLPL